MKRSGILLLFCATVFGLSAQINRYGTYVTKSYSMQLTGGAEFNWCITKDKFGAIYFGNDDNQVLRYDGSKWTTIPLSKSEPTIARSLGSDENGIVYVGGINEFGYIEPDSTGKRVYVSMTARISEAKDVTYIGSNDTLDAKNVSNSDLIIGEIKSLVVKDSIIYFLSPTALIIYKSDIDSLEYINLRQLGIRNCERLFYIHDKIVLTSNNSGLFELKEGQFVQLPGGDFFSRKICLSILTYDNDNLIVGTLDSGIFLYNISSGTVNGNFLDQEMSKKLKDLYVYCGVRLKSGEFVFGTTTDGVYVINEKGSCISHLSSRNTNMQDNAIRALYTDPNSNSELWISTTGSLTKAYSNLPFTEFSEKDGLDGSVNNFCSFNGSIYVATDKGLFKSVTEKDGIRRFVNFNDIKSQIFPLCVGTVAKDSFLLAGSTFDGIFFISSSGKSESIPVTQDPSRVIIQSKVLKNRFYVGMTYAFVNIFEYNRGTWKNVGHIKGLAGAPSYINELENGDLLILTTYSEGLFRLPFNDTIPVKYTPEKGIPEAGLNAINECRGEFFLTTRSGIYKLNVETDTWSPCNDLTGGYSENRNIDYYYVDHDGDRWLSSNEERYYDIMFRRAGDSVMIYKGGALSILTNLKFQNTYSIDGRVWLAKSIGISVIDKDKLDTPLPFVQTLLSKIIFSTHGADSLVMNETFFRKAENGRRYPLISNIGEKIPEFRYTYNSPSFFWTAPYMIQEGEILYSYKLEGFEDEWSKWDKVLYKDFTNLSFGKYTFRVRAKTITGIESAEAAFSFEILKPWYLTSWMIILYVIATILLIFAIIAAYTKRLKNENIRLEGIVAERTAVVVKQKEELESSIHYASRIQMALLPSEAILSENIKNYFVLFKPRDIVSGDFYWMTKKGERLYIVAADCTGHGVPGAFMSLLGMSFLDEIIDKESAPRADFILNQLRLHVTDSLKQVGGDDEAKDGMDMALLVIDFNTKRIEFSGAYNPCFRVRKLSESEIKNFQDDSSEMADGSMSNGKYLLETIYASKMPIGISSRMNEDFVFYDWTLERGISYYLFSDGYIDQFGGEHGRKFMKKNFKKLILEIQDYPMNKQKEILDDNLKNWMGHSPQIDDILVMGIRTE